MKLNFIIIKKGQPCPTSSTLQLLCLPLGAIDPLVPLPVDPQPILDLRDPLGSLPGALPSQQQLPPPQEILNS